MTTDRKIKEVEAALNRKAAAFITQFNIPPEQQKNIRQAMKEGLMVLVDFVVDVNPKLFMELQADKAALPVDPTETPPV